jgi:hypothetical protein
VTRLGGIFFGLLLTAYAASGSNLIKNGDFSNSTEHWRRLYKTGGAQAEYFVRDGVCQIQIQNGGQEAWHVQFAQKELALTRSEVYRLSFDASADRACAIEAAVTASRDPYTLYSDAGGVVHLSKTMRTFRSHFRMESPSDANARVVFQCGLVGQRTISIDNVRLERLDGPALILTAPSGGSSLLAGDSITVRWLRVGSVGPVDLAYSQNGGSSWNPIATATSADSFVWPVPTIVSAWTALRLTGSGGQPGDTTDAPLEIAPGINLVKNPSFSTDAARWYLGVYGAEATGAVQDGAYTIDVTGRGNEWWNVQLLQRGIALDQGKRYEFSFVASASQTDSIDVNVGMPDGMNTSYLDTHTVISLSSDPNVYSFTFRMQSRSTRDARVEFNCGKAQSGITIDNVRLTPVRELTTGIGPRRWARHIGQGNIPVMEFWPLNREYFSLDGRRLAGSAPAIGAQGVAIARQRDSGGAVRIRSVLRRRPTRTPARGDGGGP